MSIVAVAKRAGVSVATVSRVLNDLDNVRAETAEQVRAAMREIGYKPPRIKRGPKGGPRRVVPPWMRTGQISVITVGGIQRTWLGLPVMATVVSGITRAASELDLRLLLEEMPDSSVISPALRRREVDGAIVFVHSGVPEAHIARFREHGPTVWVMGGEGGVPQIDHVTADNIGIGSLAHKYLAEQGCRSVAYLTDEPTWPLIRLRGQSFANAAWDAGHRVTSFVLGADPRRLAPYGPDVHHADSLDALVDQLASMKPRPDGLFLPTDYLTTRVYPLLLLRGIRPQIDIKIISCDNEQERLEMLNPRPTSIDIGGEQIGRLAVRQLVQRLQRPNDPIVQIQVAPKIAPAEQVDRRHHAAAQ